MVKKNFLCACLHGCLIEVNCKFGSKFGHQSVNAFPGPGARKKQKHKNKTKNKTQKQNKKQKAKTTTDVGVRFDGPGNRLL